MQQDGAVAVFCELEIFDEFADVVAVDRTEVAQAVFLEQAGLDEEVLGLAFPFYPEVMHLGAVRQAGEKLFQVVVDLVVGGAGGEAVEVFCHGTDVFGDRPLVVVEDDDEALGAGDDVVERLHGDAAGERRVAADGDDVLVRAAKVAGRGHAERGGEGGAGVTRAVTIMRTLGAVEEAAHAAGLAEPAEGLAPAAGEELVHVALVGDVKHELVLRGVEDAVQRDGELDDAEIGRHVPAVRRSHGDDFVAQFLREPRQLVRREGLDVIRAANLVQQPRQRGRRGGSVGSGWIHPGVDKEAMGG